MKLYKYMDKEMLQRNVISIPVGACFTNGDINRESLEFVNSGFRLIDQTPINWPRGKPYRVYSPTKYLQVN